MKIKIKDLCTINDNSLNLKYDGDINYIDTSSVKNNVFNSPVKYLNLSGAPSRAKRVAKNGDTVLSTVRPNKNHYGFINSKLSHFIFSTGFLILHPQKNVVPYYLYLLVTSNRVTKILESISETSTSTYPSFKKSDLENITVDIPGINDQKMIAKQIEIIDAKLNLNREINDNLLVV